MPDKKSPTELPFPEGTVAVVLSHAPNPDIEGGYWQPTAKSRPALHIIQSWKEASDVCLAFIAKHGLGGGNWTGGTIHTGPSKKSPMVAYVSYNGRVWKGDRSTDPRVEIKI